MSSQDRADVVIVGGGFTGLWSAYYLLQADPDLDVVVLEAEHVGFGASGRNGGWVSSLWPVSMDVVASDHGVAAAKDLSAALRDTVRHVGEVCEAEGIKSGYRRGGVLVAARGRAQVKRARAGIDPADPWGAEWRWLDRDEFRSRLAIADADGGTFNPHCARVQPWRLVSGLAAVVRRLGARVEEGQRVDHIEPGKVKAGRRTWSARHVIVATEAWTPRLPGRRRQVAPVYSLMVATAPLPAETWDRIGLHDREVFSDHGHLITYGQRTVDDRIAFGGRGAPYHLFSRVEPEFDGDLHVFRKLRKTLTSWLPDLGDVKFTHSWGGPLGIARDWHPSVTYDPVSRIGGAGGYVGDGVAATNLAGRTLADLVLGRTTSLTGLPWVNHASPAWEPEPLRWLGINAGLRLAGLADLEERVTRRPASTGALLERLTGG